MAVFPKVVVRQPRKNGLTALCGGMDGTEEEQHCTCWKRRSKAASRSMCCLYSVSVVAPMHRSSPRANAGFSKLAASIAPSALPAPVHQPQQASLKFSSIVDEMHAPVAAVNSIASLHEVCYEFRETKATSRKGFQEP